MATVYTPSTNVVANILNRRKATEIVEPMKRLTDFDEFIRTQSEFGDTLEHLQTALSESEAYDPTSNTTADYKATVLNKVYNKINFAKVYKTSTPESEYKKALTSPQALADLTSKVIAKQDLSWSYDMYQEFVSLMENDTELVDTYVPDFSTILTLTKDQREDLIEKFLQQIFETIQKMKFYSNTYISVDSSLTAPEQARFLATAMEQDIVIVLNSSYFSWSQVDLSKRFRNMIDLGKNVKLKIVDLQSATRVGYISHEGRYSFVPQLMTAREAQPFDAPRVDHAYIVEGTFAKVTQYPATVLVASANYPDAPV